MLRVIYDHGLVSGGLVLWKLFVWIYQHRFKYSLVNISFAFWFTVIFKVLNQHVLLIIVLRCEMEVRGQAMFSKDSKFIHQMFIRDVTSCINGSLYENMKLDSDKGIIIKVFYLAIWWNPI